MDRSLGVLSFNNEIRNVTLQRNIGKYSQYNEVLSPAIGEYYELYTRPLKDLKDGKSLFDYTHDGDNSYSNDINKRYFKGRVGTRPVYNEGTVSVTNTWVDEFENYPDYVDKVFGHEEVPIQFIDGILSLTFMDKALELSEPSVVRDISPLLSLGGVVKTNVNNFSGTDTRLGLISNQMYAESLFIGALFNTDRERTESFSASTITPGLLTVYGNNQSNLNNLPNLISPIHSNGQVVEDYNQDVYIFSKYDGIQNLNTVRISEALSKNTNQNFSTYDGNVWSTTSNGNYYTADKSDNQYIILNGQELRTEIGTFIHHYNDFLTTDFSAKDYRDYDPNSIPGGYALQGKMVHNVYQDKVGDLKIDIPEENGNDIQEFDRFIGIIDSNNLDKKSLAYKTNEIFSEHKVHTIYGEHPANMGFGQGTFFGGDKLDDLTDTAKSTQYGNSRGRNLLKRNGSTTINGYEDPYCRTWTYHHQYDKVNKLIRPFSDDDTLLTNKEVQEYNKPYRSYIDNEVDGGDQYLAKNTVLRDTGFVNITPSSTDEKDTVDIKKCMFSIENLAWKDVPDRTSNLSKEQRGPNGGRIMWFPPYDLNFNENVNVQWEANTFIGRGEKVYSYSNTDRNGTLSFTLLIDHPAVINSMHTNGTLNPSFYEDGKNPDKTTDPDGDLLRFFAGCMPLKYKTKEKEEEKPKTKLVPEIRTYKETIAVYVFFPNDYSGHKDNVNTLKGAEEEATSGVKTLPDTDFARYLIGGTNISFDSSKTKDEYRGYEIVTDNEHGISCKEATEEGKDYFDGCSCAPTFGLKGCYSVMTSSNQTIQQAKKLLYDEGEPSTTNHKECTTKPGEWQKFRYRTDGDLKQYFTKEHKDSYSDDKSFGLNSKIDAVRNDKKFSDASFTFAELYYALSNVTEGDYNLTGDAEGSKIGTEELLKYIEDNCTDIYSGKKNSDRDPLYYDEDKLEVIELQKALSKVVLFDSQEYVSHFGPRTEKALRTFQENNGITDEIKDNHAFAGPKTYKALYPEGEKGQENTKQVKSLDAIKKIFSKNRKFTDVKFTGGATSQDPYYSKGIANRRCSALMWLFQKAYGTDNSSINYNISANEEDVKPTTDNTKSISDIEHKRQRYAKVEFTYEISEEVLVEHTDDGTYEKEQQERLENLVNLYNFMLQNSEVMTEYENASSNREYFLKWFNLSEQLPERQTFTNEKIQSIISGNKLTQEVSDLIYKFCEDTSMYQNCNYTGATTGRSSALEIAYSISKYKGEEGHDCTNFRDLVIKENGLEEVEKIRKEIDELQDEISALTSSAETSQKNIEDYNTQLKETNNAISEISDGEENIDGNYGTLITKLQDIISKKRTEDKLIESYNKQIEDLNDKISDKNKKIENLINSSAKDEKKEADAAQKKYEKLKEEYDKLDAKIKELNNEQEEYEDELQQISEDSIKNRKPYKAKINSLKHKISVKLKEIDEQSTKKNSLYNEVSAAYVDWQTARDKYLEALNAGRIPSLYNTLYFLKEFYSNIDFDLYDDLVLSVDENSGSNTFADSSGSTPFADSTYSYKFNGSNLFSGFIPEDDRKSVDISEKNIKFWDAYSLYLLIRWLETDTCEIEGSAEKTPDKLTDLFKYASNKIIGGANFSCVGDNECYKVIMTMLDARERIMKCPNTKFTLEGVSELFVDTNILTDNFDATKNFIENENWEDEKVYTELSSNAVTELSEQLSTICDALRELANKDKNIDEQSNSDNSATTISENNNEGLTEETNDASNVVHTIDLGYPTLKRYETESEYFSKLKDTDPIIFKKISDKIKYFDPAFHSMSPEGFNARLTFLQQCARQGQTIESHTSGDLNAPVAGNLAFGRMPVCVLRLGDFIYSRILINSISITYGDGGMQWDLNPEGAGVQPMMAKVSLGITIIGGQSLEGPISRLQNAVSFNYYANAGVYDNRADRAKPSYGFYESQNGSVTQYDTVEEAQKKVDSKEKSYANMENPKYMTNYYHTWYPDGLIKN